MFKNIKLWMIVVAMGYGLQIDAWELNVINKSNMTIDFYLGGRKGSNKTVVYWGSGVGLQPAATSDDGKIQNVATKIAPDGVVKMMYSDDPRAVAVRFYDPTDATKISQVISFNFGDGLATLIVEGNNSVGTNLAAWDPASTGDNANKPIKNSVAFFGQNNPPTPTMMYYDQTSTSFRLTTVPAAR